MTNSGKETALDLAGRGAEVHLLCRLRTTYSNSIEVTYLFISGIVTIPKQSECNVNSYNKDIVSFSMLMS